MKPFLFHYFPVNQVPQFPFNLFYQPFALTISFYLLSFLLLTNYAGAVNNPPQISIDQSSTTFIAPATINLIATANDDDGSIKNVKFYNGNVVIGKATRVGLNSYSYTWTNVTEGTYVISAKAVDNLGAATRSSSVIITVDAGREDHTLNTVMINGTRYLDTVFSLSKIKESKSITYGSALDNLNNMITLTLDIYQPDQIVDEEMHRPLIVLIHGGGFAHGSSDVPEMTRRAKNWFAQRGYVVASINYRLGVDQGLTIEPQIRAASDAQTAIRFFRAHASEYHIDPNRICTYGRSAGAITSQMVAISSELTGSWEALYPTVDEDQSNPDFPVWVAAAMGEAGRIDSNFLSAHLDSTDAGTVVDFHGILDQTVPYSEAVTTINAISAAGIYSMLYSYNAHHLDFNTEDEADIEAKAIQTLFDRVITGDQCPPPNMNVPQIPWSSGFNFDSDTVKRETISDETAASFSIYPSPAKVSFTIRFASVMNESGDAMITINDMSGKKVMQQKSYINQGRLIEEIFLSEHFIPGLYLVSIKVNDALFTQTLAVQQ